MSDVELEGFLPQALEQEWTVKFLAENLEGMPTAWLYASLAVCKAYPHLSFAPIVTKRSQMSWNIAGSELSTDPTGRAAIARRWQMKTFTSTLGIVLMLLAGCSSDEVRQSQTDLEQRRQLEAENAAREARVRAEQAELDQLREERNRRDQAAQRAATSEVPMVQPLKADIVEEEPLRESEPAPEDISNPPERREIYYEYDAYNIKEGDRAIVEAHGRFLLARSDWKLRIEGHCDERGSREYNLALGQRRADSIKRALTLLGVPAAQIEAVSFGSEKPRALAHNEWAYAQNRRSDFVYVESKSVKR